MSRSSLEGVCFLLPVWGEAYVAQFLEFCLPSLLADGNIPAAARRHPSRFQLLTRARDVEAVRAHPAWVALGRICTVEIMLIDDLVSRSSAAMLTLAYTRAMRSAGSSLQRTAFIYLVADYVLANGAINEAVTKIEDGHSGVLIGNFMVTREGTARELERFRSFGSLALKIEPHELVALSLQHLHPATRACIVSSARRGPMGQALYTSVGQIHDARANRLFWRAGHNALLGRFYLMHMFAIQPEVADFTISAPSDYALIPELCPSGNVTVIEDSDRLCLVEMQPEKTLPPAIAFGRQLPLPLATSISTWATRQHRDNAEKPVLFHAGLVDPDILEFTRREADAFLASTMKALPPEPQPSRDHPHWAAMLAHHSATGATAPDYAALDAVLAGPGMIKSPSARKPRPVETIRQVAFGRTPLVRPWHPRWPDWRRLVTTLSKTCAGKRVFLADVDIYAVRKALIACLHEAGAVEVLTGPSGDDAEMRDAGRPYDVCVALWPRVPSAAWTERLGALSSRLAENSQIIICFCDFGDEMGEPYAPDSLCGELPATLESSATQELSVSEMIGVPLTAGRRVVQNALLAEAASAVRSSFAAALLHVPALGCLAAASMFLNLIALRREIAGSNACSSLIAILYATRTDPVPRPTSAMQTLPGPTVA